MQSVAKMIDHSLLHPMLTDQELREGCELARWLDVASVCIKPYVIQLAKEILAGSTVKVGAVIGFPHGNSALAIKVAETRQACLDGAEEIDMVVNIGKVLGRDWVYVEKEVAAVVKEAHAHQAIVKVIFENDYIPDDSFKIELCRICERAGADYVKTSTGYGFIKDKDGKYFYRGATDHDVKLMRQYCSSAVKVKAAGGVRTLQDARRMRELGVERIGASATESILEVEQKQI